MAINPYSDWLGIDKSIVSPNYFELLGVNPEIEDEKALIQSVTEGARLKLAMLAKVDPVKFAEPVAKLKARIAKAVSILSDRKLRNEYRVALSRQVQTITETPSSGGLEKIITSVPSTSRISRPPVLPELPGTKSTEVKTERIVSEVEDDIPMAIPIRKVQSTAPPTPPPNQPSKDADLQPVPRFLLGVPEGPEGEEAETQFLKTIGTDSHKVRKKGGVPSWVIGIAVMLMIACVGGLLWSIQFFSNPKNVVSSTDSGTAGQTDKSIQSLAAIDRKPEPAAGSATSDDKDDSAELIGLESDDSRPSDLETKPDEDSGNSVDSTNSPNPENADVPSEPSAVQATDRPETWDVYFSNRKVRWIRRLLARREYDKARAEIASLEKSLERFPKMEFENNLLPDEESMENPPEPLDDPLVQILIDLESVKDAVSRIDEFWMTVKSNIASLSPSAELKFDQAAMILVERIENGLVLRGNGANYEFSLEFLPLEFARQIVEQGAIDDIPTWRLGLAAAMSAENGTDQLEEIGKLIEASREDGHDVTLLNEFIRFDSAIRVDWDRAKLKQGSEQKKIIDGFKNQFDYKEIKSLAPEKANQIFDSYFEAEEEDLDMAATLLSEAIELAIQSRDPYRLEDAMVELGGVANIEETKSQLDQLIKLGTAKLKPEQILKLRRVAKKYLNKNNEHSFPKLTKRLKLLLDNLSKAAAIENEGIKSGQLR